MIDEQEWNRLPTMWEVANVPDGWEIEVRSTGGEWGSWSRQVWWSECEYRARPRQPATNKVKFKCFSVNAQLVWRDECLSVPNHWVHVPSEDKTVEVPA